jgi:predicted ATPase
MAARIGDVVGLASFKAALAELLDNGYRLRYSFYQGALAQGFARVGQLGSAYEAVDTALDWAYRSKERWCVPELLRIRGEILRVEASPAALAEAGSLFLQSMQVARSQRALSWELRAATSLAQLLLQQRENAAAHATLAPVYNRFLEGFETQDLVIARAVLEEASAG